MVARVARNIPPATHSEALAHLSLSAYTELSENTLCRATWYNVQVSFEITNENVNCTRTNSKYYVYLEIGEWRESQGILRKELILTILQDNCRCRFLTLNNLEVAVLVDWRINISQDVTAERLTSSCRDMIYCRLRIGGKYIFK